MCMASKTGNPTYHVFLTISRSSHPASYRVVKSGQGLMLHPGLQVLSPKPHVILSFTSIVITSMVIPFTPHAIGLLYGVVFIINA